MTMETVLQKIVADKRLWVEARKKLQPLTGFKSAVKTSDRSFYQALKQQPVAFILECKKASPSKGLIRADFNLDAIAKVYRRYASAISVLTDEKYFQGQFEFITHVREQVEQPVLCKDFMIDPYQVYLARYYQADAILLMLSVLDDETYQQLSTLAHQLGMGVLTEVSTEDELQRAIDLKATVVGINNRNLRDLSIDLNRTKQLAPKLPNDVTVISESGIYNNQQVRELAQYADGFLIGSALMAENDLELAVRKVILGENKVCGLTHSDDASYAYQSGAYYGGLIFAKASPRAISNEQARMVMSGAPLKYIGVFQNQTSEEIVQTVKALGLYGVQLHGQEDTTYIAELTKQLQESQITCQIWKAYGIAGEQLPDFLPDVDRHLLDCKVGQQLGGTGQRFDWSLLDSLSEQQKSQLMIAGGINPSNAFIATQIHCAGLDLNSGVEIKPGQKDPQKLQAAFAAIRQIKENRHYE
ncbi:tryptophan biosynthesis protein TrpCF [Photobacterium damselae subsp. damselae]|nr:tryptophan biosynthesis protein TrpCF [Photobacterium damselae subsp. damselae]